MKSLRRIGSLIAAALLVGMIPDTMVGQASHNAYFPLPLPRMETAAPSEVLVPNSAFVSLDSPVGTAAPPDVMLPNPPRVSQASPVATQPPEMRIAAPQTPAPPFASADEMIQEQRYGRTAFPSPTIVPTPPQVAADLAHSTPGPESLSLFVHLPPQAAQRQPLRVLLALHGMGGNGSKFAESLVSECDRNGWVLVAPTMPYTHDYKDPNQLMEEDLYLGHVLHSLVVGLPKRLGLQLRQHVMIMGFSRGAQLGHRFALFHPDIVESLALIAAGSYTMPMANSGSPGKMLAFPVGVGDLPKYLGAPIDWQDFRNLSFWIGVGERDNRMADVARAFDPYGDTRLTRARTYSSALQAMGIDVQLVVFPSVDHEVTTEMRAKALEFLRKDELADRWND